LIKIQEYWKNTSNVFYCKNLTNILTDELSDLLQSHIKTTYIGLYLALNKFKYDENGNLLYAVPPITKTTVNGVDLFSARLNKPLTKENPKQDRILQIGDKNVVISDFKNSNGETVQAPNGKAGSNWKRLTQGLIPEPVPQLEYISALFSKEELSLKMALLGNFYATYFMPIHLDLIHSTIENIIFTDTIKLSNFNRISRLDYINNTQSFNASIDNSKRYYLENISISANNNTHLNAGESLTGTDIKRFGVDLLSNLTTISSNEYNLFYQQYYTGIGCIVPINFEVKFDEDNEFIQKVNVIENFIENDKLETVYKSFDDLTIYQTLSASKIEAGENIELSFGEDGKTLIINSTVDPDGADEEMTFSDETIEGEAVFTFSFAIRSASITVLPVTVIALSATFSFKRFSLLSGVGEK
jgi:hypothetical protein